MISSSLFEKTDWRITRYETPKGFDFLCDQSSLELLHEMAKFMAQHGELGASLLCHFQGDTLEAKDCILDRNLGQFDSVEQFIEQRLSSYPPMSPDVKKAIDHHKLWKIWQRKYYMALSTKEGKQVHIFRK